MKHRTTVLIIAVGLVGLTAYLKRGKSPSIPSSSDTVTISLREPFTDELIVEKTISDQRAIQSMTHIFSSAISGQDHKCASIGTISFISGTDKKTLKILPGHDTEKYEFRLDGNMFFLPRASYISSLVAAGIGRDEIRIDGHPSIKQGESLKP